MQDLVEQLARHHQLGQLEHDVTPVVHDPVTDLHEILAEHFQRPALDLLGQGKGTHEVCRIVGQRMKLEPHGVVLECPAG